MQNTITNNNEKELECADLYCGGGGTSNGLVKAVKKLGYKNVKLVAINHWEIAIATHSANYPWAKHICQNLDNVNPRDVVPGGYLDLLVASPECIFFSRARGGKPKSDQKRASAWQVLRWAEALYIENILIENVAEFRKWGPLDKDGKPIKQLEGKTYLAFIDALKSLGYNVDARVVNSADFGDPTSRQRLFIMARRNKPVIWPEPTHAKRNQKDMLRSVKPWRAAREIIDWSLESQSIFTRKKPLSPNTMRRIMKGLQKFSGLPFVIGQQSGAAPRAVNEPIPTVAGAGAISLVQPEVVEVEETSEQEYYRRFVKPFENDSDEVESGEVSGVDRVQPYLVSMYGQSNAQSVDEPLPTITASSEHIGVVEPELKALDPFILPHPRGKQHKEDNVRSVDEPMPTITATSSDIFLCEPYIVTSGGPEGQGRNPQSIDEPLGTVLTDDKHGLVEPFVVKLYGTNDGASVDQPLPTVTAQGNHLGICEPFIVQMEHSTEESGDERRCYPIERPLPTVTSSGLLGLVEVEGKPLEPFLAEYHGSSYEGGDRVRSVEDPMPTVATSNQYALCEPYIVACNHGNDENRSYPLEDPMPTVTSVDAWGIAQPFLVKYNGTGGPMSVDDPLDTIPTKDRFGLVLPLADGRKALIDIKFRMLQPHELAAAMSFPKDYYFHGKREDKVKQIGNAVAGRVAEALITALLS